MGLMGEKQGYACCPCGGVLISTFERRGYEWHCMKCGRWLGWLSARRSSRDQDELAAEYEQAKAAFDLGERGPWAAPARDEGGA